MARILRYLLHRQGIPLDRDSCTTAFNIVQLGGVRVAERVECRPKFHRTASFWDSLAESTFGRDPTKRLDDARQTRSAVRTCRWKAPIPNPESLGRSQYKVIL